MTDEMELHRPAPADTVEITMAHKGTGSLYPVGAIIGMLLQMEDPHTRISILADVMDTLHIPSGEMIDRLESYVCRYCVCRTSRLHLCDCNRPFDPQADALPMKKKPGSV